MTQVDELNFAGIVVTGLGSTVAMVGVYLQMNGYFAIKASDVPAQLLRIVWKRLRAGKAASQNQLNVAAKLGKAKGESEGKSLLGFYCVLVGFLLQMLGSGLLLWALFGNGGNGATHAGG